MFGRIVVVVCRVHLSGYTILGLCYRFVPFLVSSRVEFRCELGMIGVSNDDGGE